MARFIFSFGPLRKWSSMMQVLSPLLAITSFFSVENLLLPTSVPSRACFTAIQASGSSGCTWGKRTPSLALLQPRSWAGITWNTFGQVSDHVAHLRVVGFRFLTQAAKSFACSFFSFFLVYIFKTGDCVWFNLRATTRKTTGGVELSTWVWYVVRAIGLQNARPETHNW